MAFTSATRVLKCLRPNARCIGLLGKICDNLVQWGTEAAVSETFRWEPVTRTTKSRSEGMITVKQGPVKWINSRYVTSTEGENAGLSDSTLDIGIPDPRLRDQSITKLAEFNIRSHKVRTIPIVGRIIGFRWKGNDLGLGIKETRQVTRRSIIL